jgi:Zn finger protein HypA/HybF involved in hydrogenase expression
MVVAETYAGLNAIKTAFDMAKALKDIHNATERDRVALDLQREILSAQEQQFELIRRVHELEEKVARSDAWEAEKKRYQLKDCGSNTFAYELKATEANGEPIHLACANCYQKGQIAILQFSHRSEDQDWYECPACKNRRGYGTRVRRDINSEQGSNYF